MPARSKGPLKTASPGIAALRAIAGALGAAAADDAIVAGLVADVTGAVGDAAVEGVAGGAAGAGGSALRHPGAKATIATSAVPAVILILCPIM